MKTIAPLILASQSPRRHQLLKAIGLDFRPLVRPVEEKVPEGMEPRAVAEHLAQIKAEAYRDLCQDQIILTADTVVAVDREILGKPRDEAEAFSMLQKLSGRSHAVITGVCILYKEQFRVFSAETQVRFKALTSDEIRHYIAMGDPMDKAGAYGIQDWLGMIGIEGISGDYYNVMGLPLPRLYKELSQHYLENHAVDPFR